jgi:hypothetical protein
VGPGGAIAAASCHLITAERSATGDNFAIGARRMSAGVIGAWSSEARVKIVLTGSRSC